MFKFPTQNFELKSRWLTPLLGKSNKGGVASAWSQKCMVCYLVGRGAAFKQKKQQTELNLQVLCSMMEHTQK
jgi:hypothetical protein